MNILHIASLTKDKANGLNVVVPQHIISQAKIEGVNVAILNILENKKGLEGVKHFYSDIKNSDFLDKIEVPFNEPDLVVFHGIYFIKFIRIYKILLKKNIPYIVFPHGSLVKRAIRTKALKKWIAHILLFNRFIKKAIAIQFLTKGEQENSIFSSKGIVLPNGLYLLQNDDDKEKQKDYIQILFIGRKDPIHKGLDLLMEAIVSKRDILMNNKILFLIIGPEVKRTNVFINNMIEKYALGEIVINMDAVYGEKKDKILRNSDIFVHTSRFEGLPTAVLESMNYKMPVFVTKGTNMYEDVEKYSCGWVAETNVKSIAQQIEKIIQEKDKIKEYGNNAYKYVSENYNWEKVAKLTIKTYKSIINYNEKYYKNTK